MTITIPVPVSATVHGAAPTWSRGASAETPFRLAVHRPTRDVSVLAVIGEVDLLTLPLLVAGVREQLTCADSTASHLVLDLEPMRFLSARGLQFLLDARDMSRLVPGRQVHLAGVRNRCIARLLEITGLCGDGDTYPTLADALSALAR